MLTTWWEMRVPAALAPRLKLPPSPVPTDSSLSDGWELVVVPLGAAWLVGVAWLVSSALVRKLCRKNPSWTSTDEFGLPLYLCASHMWTQIMVLPAIFLLSLACANYSISGWVDTASSTWFTANGQRFWDWCFFYVFGGYMVEDLIVFRLGPMLLLHHIGCLAGLMFAFVVCPAGWPYFSAGAVAFEFGSALLNLYCLYPHSRYVLWAYASSMTCSNAAAGLCCAAMVLSQPSAAIGAKAFSATLTGTFILLRQKTCNDYVRKHRRAARARRKEGGGGHQRRRRWLSLPWRRAPSAACKST